MGFSAIVLANIALIVGNSSRQPGLRDLLRPNRAMWWIVGGAIAALVIVLYVPALQEIFRFGTLSGAALLISALPALGVLGAMTLAKSLRVGARR